MTNWKTLALVLALLLMAGPAWGIETVHNTDDDGDGSLREAIDDAKDGEVILFASTVRGTIALEDGLEIDKPLTIKGPGADQITIRGTGGTVLTLDSKGKVSISGVTLAGGEVGVQLQKGKLTLIDCAIREATGNGIEAAKGNVTVVRSLVADNAGAGIVANGADVVCANSTIAANGGAGIRTEKGAVTAANCTVAGNRGPGLETAGGEITVRNTLLASNVKACEGPVLSRGYNLVDDETCAFVQPGDVHTSDVRIDPLGRNGGPTETVALTGGSPAIEGGDPQGCTDAANELFTVDQRGMRRPAGARCDIGAFERPVEVSGTVVNRIIALVDGDPITSHELEQFRTRDPRIAQAAATASNADLLDVLITDRIVAKEVEAQGITVSDAEIDRYIDDVRKQNRLTEEQLEYALAEQGLTPKVYRKQIADEIARAQLINREIRSKVSVSPEEIERHQKAEGGATALSEAEEVSVSQIMLQIPKDASAEQIAAIEEQANKLHQELQNGADFSDVARRSSQDGAAKSGGKLGTLKVEELRPELAAALAELEIGEYSRPVKSSSGFHIVRLDERISAGQPKVTDADREEIKQKLYTKALEERYARWLKEDLRDRHTVEILP
ncbi:MAG: peptidylprolyl isomerase [Candidatus Binatia bacterium]